MSLGPQTGVFDGARHLLPLRVYYEDTDFSGLVYHASYLRFLERGRTEFLRGRGLAQGAMREAGGQALVFVVRRMTIDFLKGARMDDALVVETRVETLGGASAEMAQRVLRDGEALIDARAIIACVAGGRARRIPAAAREALAPA